jgi:23S rRNA (uridine2552-2'-O)-methyltransferase
VKRSKSSRAWLKRHVSDLYVKKAAKEGLRARSAYKLQEIQAKYKLIRSGMLVVDLGAAPGSWSEFAASIVGNRGKVIALDLLPIVPIPNVTFIQGDFLDPVITKKIEELLSGKKADLVISDLAPNISGIDLYDQARSIELGEKVLAFAQNHLKPGGSLVIKSFQGAGFEEFFRLAKRHFKGFKAIKPKASRPSSKEVFLFGTGFVLE